MSGAIASAQRYSVQADSDTAATNPPTKRRKQPPYFEISTEGLSPSCCPGLRAVLAVFGLCVCLLLAAVVGTERGRGCLRIIWPSGTTPDGSSASGSGDLSPPQECFRVPDFDLNLPDGWGVVLRIGPPLLLLGVGLLAITCAPFPCPICRLRLLLVWLDQTS